MNSFYFEAVFHGSFCLRVILTRTSFFEVGTNASARALDESVCGGTGGVVASRGCPEVDTSDRVRGLLLRALAHARELC
jgi:hypothetical protein